MPELDLDIIGLTRPGRKPTAVGAAFVRELEPADLPLLASNRETKQDVKRITERHHALARALASGMTEGEAGAMVGLLPARVSVLKASPAFRELMDLYRSNVDRVFTDTAARLAGLAHDAIVEIAERLEDAPEEITTGQLLQIASMAADRTGLGPSQTQNVNVTNIAERIESARRRALEARKPALIEDADVVYESREAGVSHASRGSAK